MSINSCSVLMENFCKGIHIPPFNQFSFLLKNVIVEFGIRWYYNWPSYQACPKYWTISKIAPPKKKKNKAINKNEKNKLLMVTPRCPIHVVGINITKKYICMWVCNTMAHINLKWEKIKNKKNSNINKQHKSDAISRTQ